MRVCRVYHTRKVYKFEGDSGWHWGDTKGYDKIINGTMLLLSVKDIENPGADNLIVIEDGVALYQDKYWMILEDSGDHITIGTEPYAVQTGR